MQKLYPYDENQYYLDEIIDARTYKSVHRFYLVIENSFFINREELNGIRRQIGTSNHDNISFITEINNPFDPYAVKIQYKNKLVGYVPLEYSKQISNFMHKSDRYDFYAVLSYHPTDRHFHIDALIVEP